MEDENLFKSPYSDVCDECYLQILLIGCIAEADCKILEQLFQTDINIYKKLPNKKYPLIYAKECSAKALRENCSKDEIKNRVKIVELIAGKLNLKMGKVNSALLPLPESDGHKRSCSC
jgi:hypothetical protein